MPLLESALTLLAVAVALLIATRRSGVPYPAMLALAGGCVAALSSAPYVAIEPHLALALFVAPSVMDAAFDMPPRVLLRHWVPLTSLAVLLVVVTAVVVAGLGLWRMHLPLAAAMALGAVVAPPDAAAASAVLRQSNIPRRTMAVLQGESLLNDVVALLIFGVAIAIGADGALGDGSTWALRLLFAAPGGVVLGLVAGALLVRIATVASGTVSSIIVRFVLTYGTWIVAERLRMSSIAAVAALAMVVARLGPSRTSARDRVSANAVWSASVFVLNVLAFLMVGLQARSILAGLAGDERWIALEFAALVLAGVTLVRIVWVLAYSVLLRSMHARIGHRMQGVVVPSARAALLVSWCGMRGLVTLATALALPASFPARDLIVLTAFVVVLGTLVVQGFTIRPLVALLKIEEDCSLCAEISRGRRAMLDEALQLLSGREGSVADTVRREYAAARAIAADCARPQAQTEYDMLRLEIIARQRRVLEDWRVRECIDDDAFHRLEEELDRKELCAAPRDAIELAKA
ncbi:MAG TPA: sodium:proton antiporter [Burkholderiaceae bacterium]|nr:sodium:proton antiporter [Burkholderiaceae bacterium]